MCRANALARRKSMFAPHTVPQIFHCLKNTAPAAILPVFPSFLRENAPEGLAKTCMARYNNIILHLLLHFPPGVFFHGYSPGRPPARASSTTQGKWHGSSPSRVQRPASAFTKASLGLTSQTYPHTTGTAPAAPPSFQHRMPNVGKACPPSGRTLCRNVRYTNGIHFTSPFKESKLKSKAAAMRTAVESSGRECPCSSS